MAFCISGSIPLPSPTTVTELREDDRGFSSALADVRLSDRADGLEFSGAVFSATVVSGLASQPPAKPMVIPARTRGMVGFIM